MSAELSRDHFLDEATRSAHRARLYADTLATAEFEAFQLQRRLAAKNSFSYRIAAPVRLIARLTRSLRKRSVRANIGYLLHPPATKRRPWASVYDPAAYADWIAEYDQLSEGQRKWIRADIAKWPDRPVVTIVIVLPDEVSFGTERALHSIEIQLYHAYEVLIVAPEPRRDEVSRFVAVRGNQNVCVIGCDAGLGEPAKHRLALRQARGILSVHLGPSDVLSELALYLAVQAHVRAVDEWAYMVADEDEIDPEGVRARPFFKPERQGEIALSLDLAGGGMFFSTEKLRAIDGPAVSAGVAWRWDALLRLRETFGPECGLHLPYVIVHRSEAPAEIFQRIAVGRGVVAAHLERMHRPATVRVADSGRHLAVSYPRPDPLPLVTAIVLTRDRVHLLRTALDGLLNRTDYPALEVLVVDNGSTEPETLRYLDEIKSDARVRVLRRPGAFNFAAIHNWALADAKGSVLALVNNDVEVVGGGWLSAMVAHAVRPGVGAVGAKLIYPSRRIQHAGVVIGWGGTAGHIFRGLPADDPGPHDLLAVAREVSAVTAACLVLKREVYDEVGGMDAQFSVDFNDVDLCLKIGERYAIIWAPEAELVHHESMTRGGAPLRGPKSDTLREASMFQERWLRGFRGDPCFNPNLSLESPLHAFAFPPRVSRPWAETL